MVILFSLSPATNEMNFPVMVGNSPLTNTLLLNANYAIMARGYIEQMSCEIQATSYELGTLISQ
ncbi:hypothetical protein GCM10007916_10710 [Psychromonas marina]|uniref:Uncharacterized protein n=1 Tax=Psychromonas marina TaxID=88364 RepID=A0ABQ6DXV5_9GAMM|nr:hypothetical protein GCM10007916_10710 [Psychromonas marina]